MDDFMNEPRRLEMGDIIYCNSQKECKQTFKALQKMGYNGVVDALYHITITEVPERISS